MALGFAAALFAAVVVGRRLRHAFIVVASVVLCLAVAEAYALVASAPAIEISAPGYLSPHPVLGWGPEHPGEFLHVDDLADAVVFLMKTWSDEEPINIGTGTDVTIAELVRLIADVVGFQGRFIFDPSKPDGTPRKLLNISKLTALGWCPRIDLEAGIRETYGGYRTSRDIQSG